MSCWETNGYGKVVDPFWDNKEKSSGGGADVPDPEGQANYQVIGTRNGAYQLFDPSTLVRDVPSGDAEDVGKVLTKIGDGSNQYAWLNAQAAYTDYNNSTSGLSAETVQAAIDELASGGGGGGGMLEVANLSVGVNTTGIENEREFYDYLAPSGSEIDVTGHATIAVDIIPDPTNYFVYNFSKTLNFNDPNFVSGDLDTVVLFEELGYDIGGHQSERYALQVELDVVPQAGGTGNILICEIHAKLMIWDNGGWSEAISAAKRMNSATGYARIGVYK